MTHAPSISIRNTLLPGDIGAITQLHGLLYAREYGWPPIFEAYVAQGLARFALEHDSLLDRIWIAEREGQIVGSIAMVHNSDTVAQLRWFLIDPGARGSGLGRSLLQAALEFARSSRFESVFLLTVRGLDAAGHLYRTAGFTLTEELPSNAWLPGIVEQRYDMTL
jgi:N-acetylglutamate synthase-like GNAT family acetyltransferase